MTCAPPQCGATLEDLPDVCPECAIPSAGFVYKLLIITGFIAAAIGASTVVVISYNYITRDELRNPVPVEEHDEGGHGALPGWIVTI